MNKNYGRIGFSAIAMVVSLAAVMLVSGCIFSPSEGTDDGVRIEPTSPAAVVDNLSTAYDKGDIDLYKSCLSPNFTFYFNPVDVGSTVGDEDYVIPESWGYDEDWQATENMFKFAYSISLDIATSQIGVPPEGETTYTKNNVEITLIVMTTETDGLRANGFVTFKFESYETSGKTYWRIKDWTDHTTA